MGVMALRRPLTLSSRSRSRTPALRAAAYMLSSKISQPVKTRSSRPARGTKSLILGERPSVRLPRRMVPIWVREPMGWAIPLRTASTPATNVVATAPMPGIITPSLPLAGSIVYPAPLLSRPDNFTSTKAFFSSFTLRAGDFFSFAIVWLLPCRNCGMYANQVCSRIGCAFGKRAGLNPRETRFNGVCGALGGTGAGLGWTRSGHGEAHKTSSRSLAEPARMVGGREDGRDARRSIVSVIARRKPGRRDRHSHCWLGKRPGWSLYCPGRSVPARALRRFRRRVE